MKRTAARLACLSLVALCWIPAGSEAQIFSVVSIADATVTEGAPSNQTTISMTNPAGRLCQVAVTSADGTAVAPGDYTAFVGGLFNLNGVASDVLGISVADDGNIEGSETFTVSIALTAASDPQCQMGDASATILIVDDESPVDTTAPTVAIEQAAGQIDPTATSPVLFTVVFSELVVGFDASDVDTSASTTDGTLTPTVTGGPTTFSVSMAVVGATVTGTVVATIPAGAATDGTNASLASTSTDNTVTFDPSVPTARDIPVNHPLALLLLALVVALVAVARIGQL